MTAELAVLNRTAVALAADSASTALQATGLPKIFNTADKLFHLDGISPIGIMVYGNASFMGVPWETIIKRYRSAAPSPSASLESAAEKFIAFLSTPQLLSDDHIRKWIELHIQELAGEAARLVKSEKERIGATATVGGVVADVFANIQGWQMLPGITQAETDAFVTEWDNALTAAIDVAFASDPPDAAAKQILKEIVARANLTRPQVSDSMVSGVVVAGFGEDELFPVLWNCQMRSVLTTRALQRSNGECEPLTMDATAMIRAFAQGDMVYSFMRGIDSNLRQMIEGGISELMQKYADHLATLTGFVGPPLTAFKTSATATATSLSQGLRDEIERYCRAKHVDPVLGAIGLLPKDQLAVMAETLVSLTSFKRKMSRDAETVGGDVDVAVISKGDGFVWVKRKHYFPPDLNLRYTERIKKGQK